MISLGQGPGKLGNDQQQQSPVAGARVLWCCSMWCITTSTYYLLPKSDKQWRQDLGKRPFLDSWAWQWSWSDRGMLTARGGSLYESCWVQTSSTSCMRISAPQINRTWYYVYKQSVLISPAATHPLTELKPISFYTCVAQSSLHTVTMKYKVCAIANEW